MKLQISYDFTNIKEALDAAEQTAQFADILEIGNLLLLAEGSRALSAFKEKFHDKPIFVDLQLVHRAQATVPFIANLGAEYISVLAGAPNHSIKQATLIAHKTRTKVALDLLDSPAAGQSAMDAGRLEIDLIIFHKCSEFQELEIEDEWENIRGNTTLPIFIEAKFDRINIASYKKLKPQGIIIGNAITHASNPKEEALFYKTLLSA